MTKPCPLCGATMTKECGTVDEPTIRTGTGAIVRVARPATFYACPACEHCEEYAPRCAWCPDYDPTDPTNAGASHGICESCVAKALTNKG